MASAFVAAAGIGASTETGDDPFAALPLLADTPAGVDRFWIGPEFWANRFQDWRLRNGRIQAIPVAARSGLRTLGILTSDLSGTGSGYLSVRTGLTALGPGFTGFLLGAGGSTIDHRARALVQRSSSGGGGFLVCYENDGAIRFREHTDDAHPVAYAPMPQTTLVAPVRTRRLDEDVDLRVSIETASNGQVTVTATAVDMRTGSTLASARRTAADVDIRTGISLVSHASDTKLRSWFRDVRGGGSRVVTRPERAFGPVAGMLHMISGGTLKLTAQFMPIGAAESRTAVLERRLDGTTTWEPAGSATINDQWLARFRVTGWDTTKKWAVRVVWTSAVNGRNELTGTVPRDPVTTTHRMAVLSCTSHFARPLDQPRPWTMPLTPGERFPHLYTDVNTYFPYAESVTTIASRRPDLLVFNGDQFYESIPGSPDFSAAGSLNDVVHRTLIWHWAFRDLTRHVPAVVLLDDHDVYHPNLWGWSGRPTTNPANGGYRMPPEWINAVQAAMVGHLPDPVDPAPVLQGIGVYFTRFTHGGIAMAVLEDRKFKEGDKDGLAPDGTPYDVNTVPLLGARQEAFLDDWATRNPGLIKLCLHQSPFLCMKTSPNGVPRDDPDNNGYPGPATRRAVRKLNDAGAVLISGDQHLGAVLRHGVTGQNDGPWAFAAPAMGTMFSRWFEPKPIPNNTGQVGTGDFTDPYGNRCRILAVANPKVTFATINAARPGEQLVPDRNVLRNGYGMVVTSKTTRQVTFESWPWDTPPGGTTQHPGWPITITAPAT